MSQYIIRMGPHDLLEFLRERMTMTNVYQPVVIRELLLHEGWRTKQQLGAALALYDPAVQEYYARILMRWPKATLTKHGIITYLRNGSVFKLLCYPEEAVVREKAVQICDQKIEDWFYQKKSKERAPEADASVRYQVLKEARGKCQLCGIAAEVRPIDIDHIVPRSKADRSGKVRLKNRLVHVDDRENLQALCVACNRAKRDSDETDFRRQEKLVRDRIPEIIRAEGRTPEIAELTGKALRDALHDKLSEEHAELLQASEAKKCDELVDLIEVALALGLQYGVNEEKMLDLVKKSGQTEAVLRRA